MTPKSFFIFSLLFFILVIALVLMGAYFLLPGYLSLSEGSYRNSAASVIRVVPPESVAAEQDVTTTSTSQASPSIVERSTIATTTPESQ